MTRNEINPSTDREALKEEIKSELRREARRRKIQGYCSCLIVMAVLFSIPVVGIGSVLAKTGFVEVPILTKWLYRPSAPTRPVVPLAKTGTAQILRSMGTRMKLDPADGLLRSELSEAELTTLLQEAVAAAAAQFPIRQAQIAINSDSVEIFVTSPRPKRDVTILARLVPKIETSGIAIEVKEVVIGSLTLPSSIVDSLVKAVLADALKSIETNIGVIGRPERIELDSGKLRFFIRPTKK